MSQHDYNIANAGGAAVRSDINNALAAVQSLNSGSTEPTATKPFMPWYDTTTGALKMRNAADTEWISMAEAAGGLSLRNKIINGNMGIAQRGTAAVTTNVYGPADRWKNDSVGSTFSTTQGSFVSGDTLYDTGGAQYFTTVAVTSVAGASNYVKIGQPIEDVRILAGQTVTVSFWAKAASGTPSIGFEVWQSFGTGGSPSAAVTGVGQSQALTTTWTKYTKTFTVASISGKTIGTTANTSFTVLDIWLDSGSSSATRSGSIGQASKTVSIAQVQVEIGSVSTPFEFRPIGMELALAQRYYYKQFPGVASYKFCIGAVLSTTNGVGIMHFPAQMRIIPALEQTGTANQYQVNQFVSAITCSAIPIVNAQYVSVNYGGIQFAVASGLTVGSAAALQTDATNGATAFIAWNAEL